MTAIASPPEHPARPAFAQRPPSPAPVIGPHAVVAAPPRERAGGFLRPRVVWSSIVAVVAVEFLVLHLIHAHIQSTGLADLLYVVLLSAATVGWTLWFQRLVRRHRRAEHDQTAERAATDGAQRLAALVQRSADLILVCDASGVITYASPSTRSVLGVSPEHLVDTYYDDLVAPADRLGLSRVVYLTETGEENSISARLRSATGHEFDVEGTVANRTDDPAVGGTVITLRDVTERKRLERELTRQALHDSLTNLANRRLFTDRLAHALQTRLGDTKRQVAIIFCDLDDFKAVNDCLGHGVGDTVLQEFALRAAEVVRPGDTVARLGGDEFAVLLDDLDVTGALAVAERLLASFNRPMDLAGYMVRLGMSVGVAATVADDSDGVELLRAADVAMYLAKSRGRGNIQVHDATLERDALDRLALRAELQAALDDGEIVPHFQPVVDLETGAVVGFEALARWIQPSGTVIAPSRFVPVAEETGLVHALGRAVLTEACRAGVRFLRIAGRPLDMSVNITVQQLMRPDFPDEVLAVLATTAFPAEQLVLEITESMLASGIDAVRNNLATLRHHGVRIAIDDFGTGFSSLSYLRTLPVDTLKIDKSFLDNVTRDPHDAAVAAAVIAIGAAVELTVVAEGVELAEQVRWLGRTDCDRAQGFLWSSARDEAATAASLLDGLAVYPVR